MKNKISFLLFLACIILSFYLGRISVQEIEVPKPMKDSLEDSISQKHNQQLLEADSIIKTVNDSVKIMDKKLFGFFNDDGTFNPWGIPYFTSAYQAFISRNKAKLENYYSVGFYQNGKWHCMESSWKIDCFTHWMPLPESPKYPQK